MGALILVAIVAYATARMRSGVTATPDSLTLRRTFRRLELIWSEIEDLQAVETSPEALGGVPRQQAAWRSVLSSRLVELTWVW
ncbi:MAG: PH domain-containing protein [Acidimicrobiales bacterium]